MAWLTDPMGLERRADYDWGVLLESEVDQDPVRQLRRWLQEAEEAESAEPNAMLLSTVAPTGRPHARNVLLRGLDDDGSLLFFTNRESRKGADIAGNPNVCLTFSWLGMHRQVHVQGVAEVVADEVSDDYFESRPRDSRIGAWASAQSSVVADRSELDRAFEAAAERFGEGPIPRPPYWGGYLVRATEFEFWQGRPSRMHDRLHYFRHADAWRIERLAP